MIALLKEAWILASLSYYETALKQMGASHKDYPAVLIHTTYLREQLAHIRSNYAKA
jgi:hypothetical protein